EDLGWPNLDRSSLANLPAARAQSGSRRLRCAVYPRAALVVEKRAGVDRALGFSHSASDSLARSAGGRLVSLAQAAELFPVVPEPRPGRRAAAEPAGARLVLLL